MMNSNGRRHGASIRISVKVYYECSHFVIQNAFSFYCQCRCHSPLAVCDKSNISYICYSVRAIFTITFLSISTWPYSKATKHMFEQTF